MTTQVPYKSVAAMTRLSVDLNERVDNLVQARGYRSKSNFIEDAVRNYVEQLEKQLSGSQLAEPALIQN